MNKILKNVHLGFVAKLIKQSDELPKRKLPMLQMANQKYRVQIRVSWVRPNF